MEYTEKDSMLSICVIIQIDMLYAKSKIFVSQLEVLAFVNFNAYCDSCLQDRMQDYNTLQYQSTLLFILKRDLFLYNKI